VDYQDGQSKVINGVTYVRQGGVWHSQTPMAPARQPAPQTTPQAQQDVLQVQHLGQQIQAQPLQNENTRSISAGPAPRSTTSSSTRTRG
jgi:hypothetical protein